MNDYDNIFYRDMKKIYPLLERGEGVYLYDTNGKRYLDGGGGVAVVNIGYGVEEVIEAMYIQAKKLCFAHTGSFVNEPQLKLAKKVADMAPEGLRKVFFTSGGSEAAETALKMARQYHLETGNPSKFKIISRWQSYHGNTIGALSMSGRTQWRQIYTPYLLNFPHISPPYCYRCFWEKEYPNCSLDCAYELEKVIKQEGKECIAGFIAEPVIGTTATAACPPPEYFEIVRSICNKYNVLMIVDEIITGFGRLGKTFGMDHWGVIPDIIITGKGISSGYAPLGAVIAHEKVYDAFLNASARFVHGFTFSGNPLSCAVGSAVVEYIERNNLISRVAELDQYIIEKFSQLKNLPIVGDIRSKGLLIGIEFVSNKENKTPFEKEKDVTRSIVKTAFENGLIILAGVPGNVDGVLGDHIQITPPFIISKTEIDNLVDILRDSIVEIQDKLGIT